jgi:hypothetical protein
MIKKLLIGIVLVLGLLSVVGFSTAPPSPLKGVQTYVPSWDQTYIRLQWKANLEANVIGYNVYVNGVRQNTTAKVTVGKPSYFTSSYGYYVSSLTKGGYDIKVTVVNSSGKESLPFSTFVWLR